MVGRTLLLFQGVADTFVLGPGVSQALGPVARVTGSPESPIDRPAGAVALVVAANVVAKQVVGKQNVAASPTDLGRLGQVDLGIARGGAERLGPSFGEEGGVSQVGARPDL